MAKTDETDTRGCWDAMNAAEAAGKKDGSTAQTGRAAYRYKTEAERCAYLSAFHQAKADAHAKTAAKMNSKALDAIQREGGERLREEDGHA